MTVRGLFCTVFLFTMLQSIPLIICLGLTFVLGVLYGRFCHQKSLPV